ncbi:unnamed protein product [Leptosia nina]|uniref:Uncharacterized protein n=1 Tax=Leptosia nina TaxID=320188 RepID=A0AAV1JVL5_9NEOP
MNRVFASILVALALASGIVKFNYGLAVGDEFFFDVPRTVLNAFFSGWGVAQGEPNAPYNNLTLYCHPDRVLCGFYDNHDNIAGLQIALDQGEFDFANATFDWEAQGYSYWSPPVSFGQRRRTYWTTQLFFVSPYSFDLYPRNNTDHVLRDDKLFVTGFNKEIYTIPGNETVIKNDSSIFTQQSCINWMGRHYFYNMTEATQCNSHSLFPWFPMYESNELVGVGFLTTGIHRVVSGQRDWFERHPEFAVKAIVPHGPRCLYDLARRNELITMRIYFINEPWLIGCPV